MFNTQEQIIVDRFVDQISRKYPLFDFEVCKLTTAEEVDKWVGEGMSEVYEDSDCYVLKHKESTHGCYDHAGTLNDLIRFVLNNKSCIGLANLHECCAKEERKKLEHLFLDIPYTDTKTPESRLDAVIENWRKNK